MTTVSSLEDMSRDHREYLLNGCRDVAIERFSDGGSPLSRIFKIQKLQPLER